MGVELDSAPRAGRRVLSRFVAVALQPAIGVDPAGTPAPVLSPAASKGRARAS
jgi:hypothetical protein